MQPKRGIAGSLIFQTFNREALMEEIKKANLAHNKTDLYQTFIHNMAQFRSQFIGDDAYRGGELSTAEIGDLLAGSLRTDPNGIPQDFGDIVDWAEPEYNDQLLPFHIAIAFANEEGRRARMDIFGVEILNEGQTMTIDDISLEKAMTFVARKIKYIRPMEMSGRSSNPGVRHAR